MIRIKNGTKKINSTIDLYEYLLIDNVEKFLKNDCNLKYYYTLTQLLKNNIYNINNDVLSYVKYILNNFKDKIDMYKLIKNAYEYIERNTITLKYSDVKLYPHQKELSSTINR